MSDLPSDKKLMKATRKAHRHMLRAENDGDTPQYRQLVHALYDPSESPLTHLTDGPSKMSSVPMVDAAILACAKDKPMKAELLDNLSAVGASFGYSSLDMKHVMKAMSAAESGTVVQMNYHLQKAGLDSNIGMCIPAAMEKAAIS